MTEDEKEQVAAIDLYFKQIGYQVKANKVFWECADMIELGTRFENTPLCKIIEDEVLNDSTGQFEATLQPGQKLYRARTIEINDYTNVELGHSVSHNITHGFNELNSREAPLGITSAGRNNIKGVSYLYLAEDEITACAEVKSRLREFISLSTFEVIKPLKIIDFSNKKMFSWDDAAKHDLSLATFFSNIMLAYSKPVYDYSEYKITQIITDYIRKTGIDGISYQSFHTNKMNYTIFNSHMSNVKYLDSKIMLHEFTNEVFLDFNDKKYLESNSRKFELETKQYNDLYRGLCTLLNNKE